MRTEVEIRTALRYLGGKENEELIPLAGGIVVPLNGIASDVLRWVMEEESDFGDALTNAEHSWESYDPPRVH